MSEKGFQGVSGAARRGHSKERLFQGDVNPRRGHSKEGEVIPRRSIQGEVIPRRGQSKERSFQGGFIPNQGPTTEKSSFTRWRCNQEEHRDLALLREPEHRAKPDKADGSKKAAPQ